MTKVYKDDNPIEAFLQEMAASIRSNESMPVCDFAKEVLFNGSDDFKLYPTQRAILKSFYNEPLSDEEFSILNEWKNQDRTTWVKDRGYIALVLEAGRRASKALSLNTLIETPNGTKLFKDIKPGECVFSPNGTPVQVLNETPIFYNHKIYRLHFSDGSTVDCDEGHLWKTWDNSARKAYARAKNPIKHPKVRTTKDIVNTLTVKRKDGKLENNHSIELAKPLKYKKQEQLIHPYVLGLWLGDGDKTKGMITSSEEDIYVIFKKLDKLGYSPRLTPTKNYKYRLTSDRLTKELKKLRLIKNKHIPNNYIYSSLGQRLYLIKGLMDSDGHVCKKGKSTFVNTNFQLADSVYKIANSLGCVATQSTYQGKCNNKLTKLYKEIKFRPIFTPFYIPRKIKRYKPCSAQNNKRFITHAELIPSIPVKCITVKGGLFLVGNNIITHNCNADFATINTSKGLLTYKELHSRLQNKEDIEIQTYDLETDTLYSTNKIKTEINDFEEVYRVTTKRFKTEITNAHHPYLKLIVNKYNKPKDYVWTKLSDLKVGDSIAVSRSIDTWGPIKPSPEEIDLCAFVFALTKITKGYKIKHLYRKEIRSILKDNKVIFYKNGVVYLKEGRSLDELIDPQRIQSFDRESTVKLLNKFCRSSYFIEHNVQACSIEFFCKNPYISLIENLFQKVGIHTRSSKRGIKVFSTTDLFDLVDTLGWNIAYDEDLLREYIGKKIKFNTVNPIDISEDAFNKSNIYFEKIESIEALGKTTTIALEVEDTHIIANQIVSHNSTMSSIICLKEFYDLITLDDPAKYYNMLSSSPISILVLAQSKAQVKDTIFSAIKGYAQGSLYFKSLANKGKLQFLSEEIRHPDKNVAIYAKHTRTEALVGYTIKCLILDEVARFQSVGEDGRNKAFEIWENVACHKEDNLIYTQDGDYTALELLNNPQPILTYDLKTGNQYYTDNYQIFNNGIKQVSRVETSTGRFCETTEEHPYLVWGPNEINPKWVKRKDLKVGDSIAISSNNIAFRAKNIYPLAISRLIGYLVSINYVNSIPTYLFKASKPELNSFLNTLGLVKLNSYYTLKYSKKILQGLQELLLRLGINSEVREGRYYNFVIKDKEQKDILWDTISSITDIGEHNTIGLTVEKTNIIGGSIITHNTGGTGFKEHFKKVAISSAWEPGDPIEVMYEKGQKDPLTLGFKLTTFQVNLDLVKGVTPSVVSDYTTDFVKARREYEGVRFNKFNSFIDKKKLEAAATINSCLDATPTPIDIGEGDKVRRYAGIQINRLASQDNPEELSFIHVDPALKKDSAGLAIATPVSVNNGWKIRLDGFIKWEPHTDNKGFRRIVSFLNIEDILNQIIEKRNIFRVTFDQYNSLSFIQRLHSMGIDSEQVSCTREAQFSYYMLFRDLLNHDYIILPKDSLWSGDVITELSELVLKSNKQIIHPYAGKDMADAVVNAVFQAHQYMIRSGMNMSFGLGTSVVQGSILPKVALTNTNNLKIGTARDRLYKDLLK